jgi:hypothetical protein
MREEHKYTQCKLRKKNIFQYAWIPSEFAVLKKVLKIKNDNGWVVEEVYSSLAKEHVEIHERDYKKQRQASDLNYIPEFIRKVTRSTL